MSSIPLPPARSASSITRGKARSFYLASLFLPADTRRDVHTLYAFYRTVDDLVDESPIGLGRNAVAGLLTDWELDLRADRAPEHPLVGPILELVHRYDIPIDLVCMVLEGARFDLEMHVLDTQDELMRYSILMAGSVGMVMSHLLGARDAESLAHANDLGVAMQITNVLRDVGEDLERGRVYLPREVLEANGYSVGALQRGEIDDGFRRVMRSISQVARDKYVSGVRGIPRLDRSAQFAIYLAAKLYGRILDKIEEHDFNVFTRRASLNATEKWMLTMPAYFEHRQYARKHA